MTSSPKRQVAVFPRPGECRLIDAALPEALGHFDVLVEILATAISPGTETAVYAGTHSALRDPASSWPTFPFYPGYSAAGRVLSVGSQVEAYQPGDRVFAKAPHASHAVVHQDDLSPIPAGVRFEDAAFAGLGAIALNGVRMGAVTLGEAVAVIGLGVVGLLATGLAHASGATSITASDLDESRRQKALEFGATSVVDPRDADAMTALRVGSNRRADVIIDATGVPSVVGESLSLVRDGGRFVLLGAPHGSTAIDLYSNLQRRSLRVIGAHENAQNHTATSADPWNTQRNRETVLALVSARRLPVQHVVTKTVEPPDLPATYRNLRASPNEDIGIVVRWAANPPVDGR